MGILPQKRRTTATDVWLFAATAAICWAVVTMTILHLVSSHNPLHDTLSSYAYTDRGTGMLAISIISLATGSLALLAALHTAGITTSRSSMALFGTWSAGLVVTALFPASYPEHPNLLSGEIHQYSCVVALVSLPVLGCSLLRRFPDPALTWFTVAAGGALLLLGICLIWPWLLPFGIIQRLALGTDVAVLCRVLLLVRDRARKRATQIGEKV